MSKPILSWSRQSTPEALHAPLAALGAVYPIVENGDGTILDFRPVDEAGCLRVSRQADRVTITYGVLAAALRGLGQALARREVNETLAFESLGIMLDCSRNAVMTVTHLKQWLRQLALLGYNRVMLYTEDTYQLPGEPYFGYMRGAYSAAEIRELDAYAASLGIEMIACMQTLAHMEQLLKWENHYRQITDTPFVMRVDEPETEALIEKMIRFWSENLSSRRIHIGMDEAHGLGRGKFMDMHGYEKPFDIFNRHLAKVCGMCKRHGLKPMIWSDMYFRMGSKTDDYYDTESVIPDAVKAKIPKSVELVYWDYYHEDEAFYRDWIARHRALGFEPLVGSGVWTWARFWYDHRTTVATAAPCIQACRREHIKELFFTLWGDGGAYCEFDSALAGLAWAADLSFGGDGADDRVSPLFAAVCGGDYAAMLKPTDLILPEQAGNPPIPELSPSTILWDDPLLGIGWQGYRFAGPDFWPGVQTRLAQLFAQLEPLRADRAVADMDYACCLCEVLIKKIAFRERLVKAYAAKDRQALAHLCSQEIPAIQQGLDVLREAFRRQWLRRNKPFGMEVTQIRLGAQQTRFQEAGRRIRDWLDGRVDRIDELEAQRDDLGPNPVRFFDWLATACRIV